MYDDEFFEDVLDALYDRDKISKLPKIPAPFFGLAILCLINNSNLNIPVNSLYEAGYSIGHLISPKNIEELKLIFETTNLGKISFENDKIIIADSFHGKVAKSNIKDDSFTGGFLAGCLSAIYNDKIHVKELPKRSQTVRIFEIVDGKKLNNLNRC